MLKLLFIVNCHFEWTVILSKTKKLLCSYSEHFNNSHYIICHSEWNEESNKKRLIRLATLAQSDTVEIVILSETKNLLCSKIEHFNNSYYIICHSEWNEESHKNRLVRLAMLAQSDKVEIAILSLRSRRENLKRHDALSK